MTAGEAVLELASLWESQAEQPERPHPAHGGRVMELMSKRTNVPILSSQFERPRPQRNQPQARLV